MKQLDLMLDKIKELEKIGTRNICSKAKLISVNSYYVFIVEGISSTKELIKKSKKDGEIPKPFKRVFVEKILKSKRCICGNEFPENSDEYRKISRLKDEGNYDDIDDKIAYLNERINKYEKYSKGFEIEMKDCLNEEKEIKSKLKLSKEKASEIRNRLGINAKTASSQEGENLKNKLDGLEAKRIKLLEEKIKSNNKIDIKTKEIEKLEKDLKESKDSDKRAEVANKRMITSKNIGLFCEKFSKLKDLETWKKLQDSIQETLDKIIAKPFKIELLQSYEFKVLNKYGGESIEVGESTGESQMLSLAFIGHLLKQAEELSREDNKYGLSFVGGSFPVVIDSPFGQIDEHHRPQIIEAEIGLAPQIVILASDSQWDDTTREKARPYIFSEYLIEYHKPEKMWSKEDDKKVYVTEIDGTKYEFVKKTQDDTESSHIKTIRIE